MAVSRGLPASGRVAGAVWLARIRRWSLTTSRRAASVLMLAINVIFRWAATANIYCFCGVVPLNSECPPHYALVYGTLLFAFGQDRTPRKFFYSIQCFCRGGLLEGGMIPSYCHIFISRGQGVEKTSSFRVRMNRAPCKITFSRLPLNPRV